MENDDDILRYRQQEHSAVAVATPTPNEPSWTNPQSSATAAPMEPNRYDHDKRNENDDNVGDDDNAMVTLCVVQDGPTLCFAAYHDTSRELWIEECRAIEPYEIAAVVQRVLLVLRPTLILLSHKLVQNTELLSWLTTVPPSHDDRSDTHETQDVGDKEEKKDHGTVSPKTNSDTTKIPYQVLRSSSFDVQGCKKMILHKLVVESTMRGRRRGPRHGTTSIYDPARRFPLPPPQEGMSTQQHPHLFAVSRYHALVSMMNMESTVQVQALGALVSYLHRTQAFAGTLARDHENGTGDAGGVIVKDIVRGNLSLYMNVPPTTFTALQIFATEQHPLLGAKGHGQSKEGFSLFSLLDNTKSRMGRQRLREWMQKPLVDVGAIEHRQNGVELFLQPDFGDTTGTLWNLLERVGPVDKILQRMEKSITQPQDFAVLVRSIKTATYIYDSICQDLRWPLQNNTAGNANGDASVYLEFIEELLLEFSPDVLQSLSTQLTAAVDETATHQWDARSIVIRNGYNQELDMLRDQYDDLANMMQDILNNLCIDFPYLREFLDVAFFPQIGFLLRLCDDDRWAQEGLPEDFVLVYTEGGITSFKDNTMRDLDMRFGDLDALIKDKESIAQLEDTIMTYAAELQETFGAIADLDCILSFAALAMDSGYVRPQMAPTDENLILISNGRHPLQEMILGKNFVPNDTVVDNEKRVNMITGPNYSGKSCYARQVGVLVYMAHLGCFLPCERACISVVREILVRFSVVETCTVPQSTFQMDLSQMGTILRMAGPGSLVLIDEFGKGTSPASGIALLAAGIQALTKTGAKVICTTHFIEAFSWGMLQDGQDGVKALQMAVKVPKDQSDVAIPLFQLEDGVADSSAGLVCARMAGVRPSIVDRAGEIIQLIRNGQPIRPLEEIFRAHLPFSEDQMALLRKFYQKDWSKASDAEIQDLLDAIHRLSKTMSDSSQT